MAKINQVETMKKTNDQTLKEVLGDMVASSAKMKANLYKAKINAFWKVQMSPAIGKYTSELQLRDRTLYISITSAPLRQELSYGKDKILNMINEELGEVYVEEVVIR